MMAISTAATNGYVLCDQVSVPVDQNLSTLRAIGFFRLLPYHIANIDIIQFFKNNTLLHYSCTVHRTVLDLRKNIG